MFRSLEYSALLAYAVKHTAQPRPFHLLIQQLIIRLAKQQVFRVKILKYVKEQARM